MRRRTYDRRVSAEAVDGVTVVVCTLNRGGFLEACLQDLVLQHHRPLEILVVDQSDDVPSAVQEIAEAHADLITYHRVTFRGLPEARNYGWQHARYDALVFVDDDIRCGPDLAGEHLKALQQPGVGLVAGGIEETNNPNPVGPPTGRFDRWTATPVTGFAATGQMRGLDHAKGCNWSVWRRVIEEAGGIDERLNVGAALYEELELCLRVGAAGHDIAFNGAARLTHLAAASGGCRVDKVRSYVRAMAHNRAMLIRRHTAWYQRPVAMARLAALGASYARSYGQPRAVIECLRGAVSGLHDAGQRPKCTHYGAMHRR